MRIELPVSLGYAVPPEATAAAQAALDSEDAWRPLGRLWVGWSPTDHPDGKPVSYSTRMGRPSITMYPELVPLMPGGRDAWSVANRLGATGGEWVRILVLHEVGHHRMRTLGLGPSDIDGIPEVSAYARKGPGERFAEAYALWRARPDILTDEFGRIPGRVLEGIFS